MTRPLPALCERCGKRVWLISQPWRWCDLPADANGFYTSHDCKKAS